MEKKEELFSKIAEKLSKESRSVRPGKMMSAPGITCKNKVFAFYWKKEMIFRLGKDFDPASVGLEHWQLLNPFNNRPPMAGWFVVPYSEKAKWEKLARHALAVMSGRLLSGSAPSKTA